MTVAAYTKPMPVCPNCGKTDKYGNGIHTAPMVKTASGGYWCEGCAEAVKPKEEEEKNKHV